MIVFIIDGLYTELSIYQKMKVIKRAVNTNIIIANKKPGISTLCFLLAIEDNIRNLSFLLIALTTLTSV